MAFQIVQPIAITDAILTSSNVPETDYTAWNGATAYTVGNRVIRPNHHNYERLVAGTTATAPESDATNWLDLGYDNRWRPFDYISTTAASQAGSITYTFAPGQVINTVGVLNVVGTTVRCQMVDPIDGTVFDQTITLQAPPPGADWYSYFFSPIKAQTQVIFQSLPSYLSASITITITAATGNASVGVILLGYGIYVGNGIQYGAQLGILDYSVKSKDAFGNYTLLQRAWSKRATWNVMVDNTALDDTQTLLAALRATPALWIGTEQYQATVIYGFYKDFTITISYPTTSLCALQIEGLT